MGILTFTYGVMGSSKSAQALICKHNYEQKGFNVLLLKPSIDVRDDKKYGKTVVSSRIGIYSECITFGQNTNLIDLYKENASYTKKNIIIIDEAQFCTETQINELKDLSNRVDILCYGLKTNFQSKMFEGSKRLFEIADQIDEISYICKCGNKAIINARIVNGRTTINGDEILIGGDNHYEAMCYNCWKESLSKNF